MAVSCPGNEGEEESGELEKEGRGKGRRLSSLGNPDKVVGHPLLL